MKSVALKEANQQFSQLVKEVEAGETLLITRRGKPIAKIVPVHEKPERDEKWWAAYEKTKEIMEKGGRPPKEPWRGRDELYERD